MWVVSGSVSRVVRSGPADVYIYIYISYNNNKHHATINHYYYYYYY